MERMIWTEEQFTAAQTAAQNADCATCQRNLPLDVMIEDEYGNLFCTAACKADHPHHRAPIQQRPAAKLFDGWAI